MSLMLTENCALRANLLTVSDAYNFEWLLMQQTYLIILSLLLFFLLTFCQYCRFLWRFTQRLWVFIDFSNLCFQINWSFQIFTFVNCWNELIRFVILLNLFCFNNFGKINWFVFKRRISSLALNDFDECVIFWKSLQSFFTQVFFNSIIRAFNIKGMVAISILGCSVLCDHFQDTKLTKSVSTLG